METLVNGNNQHLEERQVELFFPHNEADLLIDEVIDLFLEVVRLEDLVDVQAELVEVRVEDVHLLFAAGRLQLLEFARFKDLDAQVEDDVVDH